MNNSTAHEPRILDTNNKKADVQAVVDVGPYLSLQDKNKLLELLKEFEELFAGTLHD